jgi:hypothetical protein
MSSSTTTNEPNRPNQSAAPTAAPNFIERLPPSFEPFFSDPPLRADEDRELYEMLQDEVAEAIEPKDLVEFIWVRHLTVLTWQIWECQRIRARILELAQVSALRERFKVLLDDGRGTEETLKLEAAERAKEWLTDCSWSDPKTENHITEYELTALAYLHRQKEITILDNAIAAAETRRNKVLREIESRRDKAVLRKRLNEIHKQRRELHDFRASKP